MLKFAINVGRNVCYRRINPSKSPTSGACNSGDADVRNLESRCSRVHVDQFVFAFRAMEVPVYFCLRSSCKHVTEVGGP